MIREAALAAALLLVGCGDDPDGERLGDRAYAARDYTAAYNAYVAAAAGAPDADLLAKLGITALREGDTPGAIDAFERLAVAAPDRSIEAAEGLAAAARLAVTQRNAEALKEAVAGLRRIAPDYPVAPWVVELGRRGVLSGDEIAELAPAGFAVTSDAAAGDSLLVAWADARVAAADCDGAGSLYRAAARRTRDSGLSAAAQSGAAACALAIARQALAARDTITALASLGSVQQWAGSDSGAAAAAELAAELRKAAERLPPMDTTFFMEDR